MKTWKKFGIACFTRAARTVFQTLAACIGTAALFSEVDWGQAISAALLAGVLSMLTSLATNLPEAPFPQDDEEE